jgi:hypothetical protein
MEWRKGRGVVGSVRTREEWRRFAGYIGLRVLVRLWEGERDDAESRTRAAWTGEAGGMFAATPSPQSHWRLAWDDVVSHLLSEKMLDSCN